MLKNVYTGKNCILGLNSLYQKMIYDVITKLDIADKSDNSYSLPGIKEDINIYDKSKPITIIYTSHDVSKISKMIIDILGNYIYNRQYYEYRNPVNGIFSRIASGNFKVDFIDGMMLVDKRLSNISLIDEMYNIDILFIKVRVEEASYRNYHLTINDVIRARECKNLVTVLFFKGTPKEANKLEYLELNPREIYLLDDNKNKYKAERNSHMSSIDYTDVLT